ncbi:hypothetical protein METUNv1_01220 [Methyloversatilis universalis FAM5]|uniref:Uncharacterized protein n=1 Tax=Methyloversatilis universalis (strain ATCC BAA-1314 / DSM 25237 / JCM 13912 / CCUG 52030 / FAM5) TaxID=1000565 RepID=F5RAK6_METUF|nr:hypothetical protein [Methyloversatilis universalis]EGK72455.1 hypothetical protein METUNv1_01220 [Methyloversatilis universalis FAM5]
MPSITNPFFQNASAQKVATARDMLKAHLQANRETKVFTFAQLREQLPEVAALSGAELRRVCSTLQLSVTE